MLVRKVLKQRYEITKAIGSGAFGTTYVAIDRDFPGEPRRVVKHLCPTYSDLVSLELAKKLFATEAECLAKLGEHDRIPRLFSYFEEDNEFYLVQELIAGHNLTQEFERGRKWSESETVDFLSELLSILSIVHQNNTIHRDIKPANIMRRQIDNKLVLIDFGAVKAVREVLTVDRKGAITTTVGIGTIPYMPPEQAMGIPKKSSDIYAVGMIGVQALTGFSARNLPSDSEGLQDIWQNSNIEVSDRLKSILEQMTCFQYKRRFADADAALKALIPPKSPQKVQSQNKKKVLLALLTTLGLASVGAGTKAFMARPDYTQLETYLQNEDWQNADEETDKIILGIAREESELDTQSINQLPCQALQTIDALWTENSNGRFGFTPQKQAYIETGNEFDGTSAESMYKAFGDRLGWRTKMFGDNWNVYGDLKFKNNDLVPLGHLPSPGKVINDKHKNIRHNERGKLLTRFDACGL